MEKNIRHIVMFDFSELAEGQIKELVQGFEKLKKILFNNFGRKEWNTIDEDYFVFFVVS